MAVFSSWKNEGQGRLHRRKPFMALLLTCSFPGRRFSFGLASGTAGRTPGPQLRECRPASVSTFPSEGGL